MRADRLVAALAILQTRDRVTAAQLAAELEVSVRTARRDLEALALAGFPVYSSAGRGGGWSLLGGGRTDLSGLTAGEARALFMLAGPHASGSAEATAALRKLVRALPAPFQAEAQAAAAAIVVDPAGWGGLREPAPPSLEPLRRAIVDRRQVRLEYEDRRGVTTARTVHPLGLVEKGSVWYLVADTDRGLRTFRLSRVRSVVVTDRPARRPEAFDLARAWEAVVGVVEARRAAVRATVRAEPPAVPWLRVQFGAQLALHGALEDGRFEAVISGPSAAQLADELAGWGSAVEVVAPPAVRAELARIGAQLVGLYGSPDPMPARGVAGPRKRPRPGGRRAGTGATPADADRRPRPAGEGHLR